MIGYYAAKTAASLRSRAGARAYQRLHPEMRNVFRAPDYEALYGALVGVPGLEVREYPVDERRYREWLAEARYPTFAYVVNRTEKFLEHQISFDLLAAPAGATVMDVASCRSAFPTILRRKGYRAIAQDLEFAPGLHDDKLGGSAAAMELPAESVDGMTMHCSFEHFEGDADTGFVREAGRVLRPGGRVVILPLYVHEEFINMTDPIFASQVPIDEGATAVAVFGYANRFGRHYSVETLRSRVIEPALANRLSPAVYRIRGLQTISPRLYVNLALVLTKTPS
jgi:SAM-dependent methyltransferase